MTRGSPPAPPAGRRSSAGRGTSQGDYKLVAESDTEYDKGQVKSAQRALQVFEYFTDRGAAASASEITGGLALPQSSTSLLLRTLVNLGYLDFDPASRLYRPSLHLSLLGAWKQDQSARAARIVHAMEQLGAITGECVMLAERYRHFIRYIYVVQRRDPERSLYLPVGTMRPICGTAAGRILLARLPMTETRSLIHAARNDPESDDFGILPEPVLTAVGQAVADGYAQTSRPALDQESFQLAVPVITPDQPPLALGLLCLGERFVHHRREWLAALVDQAERI
ncbi:helix-turn-helix domain-containing protein [Sphingobium sp. H39-3-25]|uniref:IclR family transcriptional regulator n=1 Tax=Sphingobium arseniciresistens TaxID=3030834 RepID=UPI0023B90D3F|nr:helix-turn-helix domain-containing protein [Sphingobium arseniciresistens]